MGQSDNSEEYFYNRQQVMYIINSLMANEKYVHHSAISGRQGVLGFDIATVLAELAGMQDEFEGVEVTVNGIINEMIKQRLLISTGEGAVMNPHPPIDLDTESVDLVIGRIMDKIEGDKQVKKETKKRKEVERKAKKAEIEELEREVKRLEEEKVAKKNLNDVGIEEDDEGSEEVDEDDQL